MMRTRKTAEHPRNLAGRKMARTLSIVALAAMGAVGWAAGSRPNVVIILTDDMGISDIGAYGSEIKTPNIDRLAEGGKKFTQFYNTARCCPSRAALLTGLYPHQAGVGHMLWDTGYPGYAARLSSNSITIAEALRTANYKNYMVGKWHLSDRVPDPKDNAAWPLQRGFDRFYGTIQGYGSFMDPASLTRDNTYITPMNDPEYKTDSYYYTDAISDNAVKYLQDHKKNSPDAPFFLYVAYTAAHWPIQAPDDAIAPYRDMYKDGYEPVRQQRWERMKQLGLVDDVSEPSETIGDWESKTDKQWEAERMQAFAGMISRMDEGIGKITKQLASTGDLDNTVIFYMHDNGGCPEDFFHGNTKEPENVRPMGPDELQTRTIVPMQTRAGEIVRTGHGAPAGPELGFIGYGPEWSNVSNTPLKGDKRLTYEGGISSPLIVHWPAGLGKGAAKSEWIKTPAHLIDILPTVVDVAGTSVPAQRAGVPAQAPSGVSLLPVLKAADGDIARKEPLFWEHEGSRAIRDGKWKLVAEPYQPWQLYDISTDRAETKNLAEEQPDKVRELADAWHEWAARTQVYPYGAAELRKREPAPANAPKSLTLKQGDVLERDNALALNDVGVSITAQLAESANNGVIVAQGGTAHGYTLYVKKGTVGFAVRRGGKLQLVEAPAGWKPGDAAVVQAQVNRRGQAMLTVDGKAHEADFYGPLLETPGDGLSVGTDSGSRVGEYPENFTFKGQIESVAIETLR